jgi:hypothetical protein
MGLPRLQRIDGAGASLWRVSYVGMERDFVEDWKAVEFYQQLLSRPTNPESLLRVLRSRSIER